jgi:hypothetical protein
MGKKRRLKSAKAKFRAKHSNHPRMQYINSAEKEEVKEELEVVTAKEPAPEVVLQEEKVEEKLKVTQKPKTTRKPRRSPRKKATKKAAAKAS